MKNTLWISGLKRLRILQKQRLHNREAKQWLIDFPNVTLAKEYKKEIDQYWGRYGVKVSGNWHRFFLGCTGIEDPRFLDNGLYYSKVICRLNRLELSAAYDDKNGYDLLFGKRIKMPKTILRNMNGVMCDSEYKRLSYHEAKKIMLNTSKCIVKPTMGTNGGKGIIVLNNNGDSQYEEQVESILGNKDIVVQEFIKQDDLLKKFNSASVNTVRVCSFLWKGEVNILAVYLHVGNDNEEFVKCSTDKFLFEGNGKITKAIDVHRRIVKDHKYKKFSDKIILPGIEKMKDIVNREHIRLNYFSLIGWDFTVDNDGDVVLLEINTHWPALDSVQMLNGPAFGDMTDDVMKYVFCDKDELKKSIYIGI